jgi:hypothetical protein
MAIASLADLRAARRERLQYVKVSTGGSIFGVVSQGDWPFWGVGGTPGAGGYVSNLTTGVLLDNTTTGALALPSFSGNAYLASVSLDVGGFAVFGVFYLYDRLWAAGTFLTNTATTFSSQPSYSARVPGGTDYTGTQIWLEETAANSNTQNATYTITYTNQAGTPGQSTGAFLPSGNNVAFCRTRAPMQAGDTGVQKIESVTVSNATTKSWGVVVRRPIWQGALLNQSGELFHTFIQTGLPEIFGTSCLELGTRNNAASGSNSPGLTAVFELAIM